MNKLASKINFLLLTTLLVCFSFTFTKPAEAAPNIANYYLKWSLTTSEAEELAKWDVVILDMEIGTKYSSQIKRMRYLNPDIIILAYITPQEIRNDASVSFSTMRRKLVEGIDSSWYLTNTSGKHLSWWPGTSLLNVTNKAPLSGGKRFNDYLVGFVVEEILSTDLWDGIFYDNCWDNITYFAGSNIDLNRDGRADSNLDQAWREGMEKIYSETRRLAGDDYIIIGNGDTREYLDKLNGKMLENFSTINWSDSMQRYEEFESQHESPILNIINSNGENNGGGEDNYDKMRFGLTSALMEDGYYSYDYGDKDHSQLWWYDEYDVELGEAIGDATSKNGLDSYKADVWKRDYENGVALVNSTGQRQTVSLGGEYEKIHGTQDQQTNDGSIVTETSIGGYDGLILLKTFSSLNDVIFTNGDFARFFRANGERARNGFFIFEEGYEGGDQIIRIDLDNNGKRDIVLAHKNKLYVWRDDGQTYTKKYPYGVGYNGTLRIAVGDLNSDNLVDIFVAPQEGYPAPIKVYTRHGRQKKQDWYPFGENYDGGYYLAVGDVSDDIKNNELIIGTGSGVKPEVYIYDRYYEYLRKWYAFEQQFFGGVRVASGDVDGDGTDEIVVGAGPGKKPVIRIFDQFGLQKFDEFTAYSSLGTPGIDVRTADVDYDGVDEIVGLGSSF